MERRGRVSTARRSAAQQSGGLEIHQDQIGGDKVALEFDAEKTDCYGRLLTYIWLADDGMFN
jgi:hypothetical protein